jgi:transposase-like protein
MMKEEALKLIIPRSIARLSSLTRELLKITVEASLNVDMEAHLDYPKHSPSGHNSGNSRNGYGSKSLKGNHGVLEIETPRDESAMAPSNLSLCVKIKRG